MPYSLERRWADNFISFTKAAKISKNACDPFPFSGSCCYLCKKDRALIMDESVVPHQAWHVHHKVHLQEIKGLGISPTIVSWFLSRFQVIVRQYTNLANGLLVLCMLNSPQVLDNSCSVTDFIPPTVDIVRCQATITIDQSLMICLHYL